MAFTWYLKSFGSDPNSPASYSSVGSTPPSCPGTTKICAIFADDNGLGDPIIDSNLQSQMTTALNTSADQPRVLLRSTN